MIVKSVPMDSTFVMSHELIKMNVDTEFHSGRSKTVLG